MKTIDEVLKELASAVNVDHMAIILQKWETEIRCDEMVKTSERQAEILDMVFKSALKN